VFRTLILITIFDQFLSFWDESTNVVELELIDWVRKDLIPRSTCEASVWRRDMIKFMDSVRIVVLESEVFSHIHLLLEEFISLGELNSIEEVWEVLVNADGFMRHCEAPLLKVGRKDLLDKEQDSCTNGHEEQWECRTNLLSF